MTEPVFDYPCAGVCIYDPESDSCLGCGRPSSPTPDTIQEIAGAEDSLAITAQVTPAC